MSYLVWQVGRAYELFEQRAALDDLRADGSSERGRDRSRRRLDVARLIMVFRGTVLDGTDHAALATPPPLFVHPGRRGTS